MLIRKALCDGRIWRRPMNYMSTRNVQTEIRKLDETFLTIRKLPAMNPKKPQREPFVKNLFLGKFDKEFLTFPEPRSERRHEQFFEWIAEIERYTIDILKKDGFKNLETNEVFKCLCELNILEAKIAEKYDGLGLCELELAKLLETVSCLPWLSTSLVKNNFVPVDIIDKFGTSEQKAKYLSQISRGQSFPTVCITESSSGPNVRNIETVAVKSTDNNSWILNGTKMFVTNAQDSNLFLVLARIKSIDDEPSKSNALSMFIVDKDSKGISCNNDIETIGQREVNICTVNFEDTIIPSDNVIGEIGKGFNILSDIFPPGKQNTAPQAVAILRNFVKLLTEHIIDRRHHDKDMSEFEAIRKLMGSTTCSLYAMESILYLTAAMFDTYEKQNVDLEKAIVETFCANQCVTQIYEGLKIIGVYSYIKDNPYMKLFQDASALITFDQYYLDGKMYVSLSGLREVGQHYKDHIYKKRNPFLFFPYAVKEAFSRRSASKYHLKENVHPSFETEIDILEVCLDKLQPLAILLLEQYGSEITEHQNDIDRLSDIATNIYVLVASISRASRSYCVGSRHSDCERHIVKAIAFNVLRKINILESEIKDAGFINGDVHLGTISLTNFEQKSYFPQHPLVKPF